MALTPSKSSRSILTPLACRYKARSGADVLEYEQGDILVFEIGGSSQPCLAPDEMELKISFSLAWSICI
jgi:hypothetical protein